MKIFPGDTYDEMLNRLVSYYKMEDATDFFGANDLTNNNGVLFQPGKIGNAALFDGATNFLSVTPALTTDTTFISFGGWVFVPTALEAAVVFHSGSNVAGYAFGVSDGSFSATGNKLTLYCPGVATFNFNVNIGIGWHHVMITRGASTWRGYIDGVVCPATSVINPIAVGANPTRIGGSPTSGTLTWPDRIDEFALWRRELSQTEITFLYNAGVGKTMLDANLSPTVPTTAILENFTQNHSAYYGGAGQIFAVVFPAATLQVLAQMHDGNAEGMYMQKLAEDAHYQILGANSIRIQFHAEHKANVGSTRDHGVRFSFPAVWPEVGTIDHSNALEVPIGGGKQYYQTYKFTIDLTVDVSTLGILSKRRKHHGGELWGIIPEVAGYLG